MLRIAFISTAALMGAAVAAHAGDPGDPNASCDGGTYQMVECLAAQTAYWDKRLNAAYQEALKDAKPEQREQLRASQRLWIQYRDANCLYYRLGEGSIAMVDAGSCMLRMTKERTLELEGPGDRN